MKFKLFVKIGIIIIEVILSLMILITLTGFAMYPFEPLLFTNALMLALILVQLFMINILINIYEKFEIRGGRRK